MPRIERTAELSWEGGLARGTGLMTAASGAFAGLGFSLPARIEKVDGKTSPEELLAAAHGGCLTMSLVGELRQAGVPPGRLDVHCTIVMDEVASGSHQIVGSHVEAVVSVEGLDDATLQAALAKADEGCPFSTLLRNAGAAVDVSARLA
jgi:lipoyl-dependent peroxiredoxin